MESRYSLNRVVSRQNRRKVSSEVLKAYHRIKVAVRLRPLFTNEIFQQHSTVEIKQKGVVILNLPSNKRREFIYDETFGPSSTQDEIFEMIAHPVVKDMLTGKNGCIMAYGQTGTGKVQLS